MNEFKVLFPEKEVRLSCGPIVSVRALRWIDSVELLRRASAIIIEGAPGLAKVDAGTIASLLVSENLGKLLAGVEQLRCWLLTRVVLFEGVALSDEQIASLPMVDAMRLLDAALEVNLCEEVLSLGKSVGGRFAAIVTKKVSVPSIPSSSATATAAKS
ncbi:MAG: hypothetical protein WA117_20945 [Verrucomicrobiia bacterium]